MKLYYSVGACSLTQHILLELAGLEYSTERVDLKTKKTESGNNFREINPRGQVPTIALDNGSILTENIAIAQYIADKTPTAKLLAPVGDFARYQTLSWMSYVATELHKAFGPLFHSIDQSDKDKAIEALKIHFTYVNKQLTNRSFIATDNFTIADAYLFVVLRWRKFIPNLPSYPAIDEFMQRVNDIDAVKKVIDAEEK